MMMLLKSCAIPLAMRGHRTAFREACRLTALDLGGDVREETLDRQQVVLLIEDPAPYF